MPDATSEPPSEPPAPSAIASDGPAPAIDGDPRPSAVLCPYCGHRERNSERCGRCGGLFEPLSREATQIAMGPWQVRDESLPFRPGFSYETLRRMVAAGRVTRRSILRGPSTQQFWSLAENVRGVAHLLGVCYRCQTAVREFDTRCPSCGADFTPPPHRDQLGLRYPRQADADKARRRLDERLRKAGGSSASGATTTRSEGATPDRGADGGEGRSSEAMAQADGGRPDASSHASDDMADRILGPGDDRAASEPEDSGPPVRSSPTGGPSPYAAAPVPEASRAGAGGGTGISPLTWMLIGVNVIALIAVIWLGIVLGYEAGLLGG